MPISRRTILKSLALGAPLLQLHQNFPLSQKKMKGPDLIQSGPFVGSRASLRTYEIPEWFRDAKFGIWAHWGPQSAVEAGDWYARNMYIQGNKQNSYHLKTYGHPSNFGFKDTISAWKAQEFDADYLLDLYKKAGAKYFMTMGVHHDNFDLWNSRFNRWNAVKMGPKKDIVKMFKEATYKQGLKFGISDHLWISYKWFSSSKGSDTSGPYAGVPYDGADPKNFEYYGNCDEVFNQKLEWNENGIPENWKKHWFDRIKDLVDQYEPDLLYCDGHLPFEDYGLNLLAHFYNKKTNKNGGKTQAVYTSKRLEDASAGKGLCVFDVERGVVQSIWPLAWQTDTCIGDWHYDRERAGKYKTPKTIVDLLVDIVSRNGNLMLNFPLPASGMLDSHELLVLEGITKWMAVNSEGIYSTRPWKIFGEGPQSLTAKSANVENASQFNEKNRKEFSYEDLRFTTKSNTLYCFFMGWPDSHQIIVRSLALFPGGIETDKIENVALLGYGKVEFMRDKEGLKVKLPLQKPGEHAYTLKISGQGLV
ncbi:MAG: alpha-L-fucosidase [Flavisolibacter sp.]